MTRRAFQSQSALSAATMTFLILLAAGSAAAQSCQEAVPDKSVGKAGYRLREDGRCEGYFARLLSAGKVLRIVSLTSSGRRIDISPTAEVPLSWKVPPGDSTVKIRVGSILQAPKYLMTITRAGRQYTWPLSVLSMTTLAGQDLGFRLSTEANIGGKREEVQIPIAVGSTQRPQLAGQYELVVVPEKRIRAVQVCISVHHDGSTDRDPSCQLELVGPFASRVPFIIELSGMKETGFYRVQINAPKDTAFERIWVYHVAPQGSE